MFINLKVCRTAGFLFAVFSTAFGCYGTEPSTNAPPSPPPPSRQPTFQADVIVYAATPSGIMASIEAAHLGKTVILLEPSQHVGGMTSSGLGSTDLYNERALKGLVQTFFQTVSSIYAADKISFYNTSTLYSPRIAEEAFNHMINKYADRITLIYGVTVNAISQTGTVINSIAMSNGALYIGKEFIDASYEGDLMAAAKVSYTWGRESRDRYHETYGGVGTAVVMGEPIDPYIVPGDSTSGLIPHVAPDTLGAPGTADKSIMAYNYRLCMTADPANQVRLSAPTNYDPAEFEVIGRLLTAYQKKGIALSFTSIFVSTPLPENKRDINNGFFVSTDNVGESAAYPEASLSERQKIAASHKEYLQGLLYFLATDTRVPAAIQTKLLSFGLCKDEFTDNGGWPRQLYVREARRMIGEYVMTEKDAELKTTIPDPIGLGGYNFDMHNANRIARNGMVYFDGRGVKLTTHPYPISYRSLTPKAAQATNLLVPVDVSASHVAYESLRVEVTYMIMGQAAGAAASLAIDGDVPVQSVDYSQLRTQLVEDGQVVTWP